MRVPVLSLHITLVHPNVCTEGRLRTIEFFFAILRVPNARQVVITAGNPSGMAATASATAICKWDVQGVKSLVKSLVREEGNSSSETNSKVHSHPNLLVKHFYILNMYCCSKN